MLAAITLIAPGPVIQPVEYENQQYYRTSHALIIGVESGPNGMATFGSAARQLRNTLVNSYGFPADNVVLLDQGRGTVARILQELRRLEDSKWVSADDRVVVAVAMHGVANNKVGEFLAVDGKLPMTTISDSVLNKIPARQVIGWLDACHAEMAVSNQPKESAGSSPIPRLSQLPVRQIWAGAAATERTITNDSAQKSSLISEIDAGLKRLAAKEVGFVTDLSLFTDVVQSVSNAYAVKSSGSMVFRTPTVAGFSTDTRAAAARQRQLARARDLAIGVTNSKTNYERRLRDPRFRNSPGWAITNLEYAETVAIDIGLSANQMDIISAAIAHAEAGITPDSKNQAYLRLNVMKARVAQSRGFNSQDRQQMMSNLSTLLEGAMAKEDARHFASGFVELVRLIVADPNDLVTPYTSDACSKFASHAYRLVQDGYRDFYFMQAASTALAVLEASRPSKSRTEADRVVEFVELGLQIVDIDADPTAYAYLHQAYATILNARLGQGRGDKDDVNKVLSSVTEALQIFDEECYTLQWAGLQSMRAITLLANPTLKDRRNEGLEAADQALTVFTEENNINAFGALWLAKSMALSELGRKAEALAAAKMVYDATKEKMKGTPLAAAASMRYRLLGGKL